MKLFDAITVHCFFAPRCKHVVKRWTPEDAHDAMEQHYREMHAAQIKALT